MAHERRIFVDDVLDATEEVSPKPADARHLERVLRLKVGDAVTVVDKRHQAYRATVSQVNPMQLRLHGPILGEKGDPVCPVVHVICGLPKGPASDAIVEGASEFGVARITFWQAERSIPNDGLSRLRRWQLIAESAAKQSGQRGVSTVSWERSLEEALATLPPHQQARYLCSLHPEARPLTPSDSPPAGEMILAFGPEGDVTANEESLFHESGFGFITLGTSRLRCQTAVIAAISGAYALRLSTSTSLE